MKASEGFKKKNVLKKLAAINETEANFGQDYCDDELIGSSRRSPNRKPSPKADHSFKEERVVVLQQFEPSGTADTRRLQDSFRKIAGVKLSLADHADIVGVRRRLAQEFPYAVPVIDKLLMTTFQRQSVGKSGIAFKPSVLWGAPGLGKSRLARRVCEELEIPHRVISAAGMVDDQILGVGRGFSSGLPSVLLELVRDHEIANPVVIIDEIDKVLTDSRHGNIVQKLLPLLEKSEAEHWHDGFLGVPVNVSALGWIFTANDISHLPQPFRSRVQALHMPAPGVEHLGSLVNALRTEFAEEDGLDPRWLHGLDEHEMSALRSSYQKHQSVRILKQQLRQLFNLRTHIMH